MTNYKIKVDELTKHIRAVHLIIVVFSIALVLASFEINNDIDIAIDDLIKIRKSNTLWANGDFLKQYNNYVASKNISLPYLFLKVKNTSQDSSTQVFRIDLASCWTMNDETVMYPNIAKTLKINEILNLDDFKKLWNALYNIRQLKIFESFQNKLMTRNNQYNNPTEMPLFINIVKDTAFIMVNSIQETRSYLIVEPEFGDGSYRYLKNLPPPTNTYTINDIPDDKILQLMGEDDYFIQIEINDRKSRKQYFENGPFRMLGTLYLPVTLKKIVKCFPLKKFSGDLKSEWKYDDFDNSFKELTKYSKSLESLNLNSLYDYLINMKNNTGKDISVLGINIPFQSLSRWGIIILLMLQFYLYINIRQLRNEIPNPSAEIEPWLTLYPNNIARITAIISITVIPVFAVLFISVKYTLNTSLSANIGWFLFATVITAILSIATFKDIRSILKSL